MGVRKPEKICYLNLRMVPYPKGDLSNSTDLFWGNISNVGGKFQNWSLTKFHQTKSILLANYGLKFTEPKLK